jgi:sporulation protein YlmC with PRC-barrel domain
MAEVDIDTALDWRGRTVVDRDGEKIGTLKDIYLDESERPHWGSVHTGLFGTRETLVPLEEAREQDGVLRLPYEQQHVKDAPNLDPDVQLTADEERALYRHYGRAGDDEASAEPADEESGADADTRRDPAGDAMTRSEEEVQFTKRPRARGRARLKKYVVTDYVEKKVPVEREEVRLEYEPTDESERGQ